MEKNKKQLLILIVVLVIIIGGSTFLYQRYKGAVDMTLPDNRTESAGNSETAGTEPAESEAEREPVTAPDFTVTDQDGNEVTLSELRGKPVVLNFWASWCPPCKGEMPEFNKVYEELGEEVHFMMIDAVDGSRETVESGAAYIAEQEYTFPVYFDVGQTVIMQYGVRAFPSTLFIDAQGIIVTGYEGAMDEAMLRQGIEMSME